ncbi:SDR family oxidoreductase [Salinibacterium sp. SYSU T00001]|uniref:SDR family NAD(P)-dependent oxidoreductase n=1 Tax=Homoserinimonas sedimenticola TaxID=2986805 RepID=UPI002235E823|nr:SDR family oxidoreductase [Salinibacterium sedimenticola]MCW4385261.1 SDR family oxidoreductase [Salinibacterium sedimenticola]
MTGVLDRFRLDGRVALVTGSSRGIGRALAQALGEAGAAVAVTARSQEHADAAADELRELGIRSLAIPLEVTDVASVESAVEHVVAGLGGLDILVNNAGVSIGRAALDTPDELWREVMATNLDGVWHCSRAAGRHMAAHGGGTIVTVGSMSAEIVNRPRWQAPYLAAKAGVHQLTKALAAEWAPHGIRVNAIAPGYILTESSPVDQPEYHAHCVEPAALGRYGLPHELGPVTVLLASEASSFMTGSIVTVDGGYTLF